jgi:hypothetical protein
MFKTAVFSPAHPARAKTRAFPVGGRTSEGARRYIPSFACTARFDQMRADSYFASSRFAWYVERPSDARTKLAAIFNIR